MVTQPEATVIASIVVIAGGVISYLVQKRIDRKEADHREFRDRLHAYFEASKEAEGHIYKTKDTEIDFSIWAKFEASFYSVRMLSPSKVIPMLDEHRRQIGKWHTTVKTSSDEEELNTASDALTIRISDLEEAARKVMGTGSAVDAYKPISPRIRKDDLE